MSNPIRWWMAGASGLAAVVAPALAHADVQSSSPQGFVIRIETAVATSPAAVYDRLFEVGQWWSPQHTYSGVAGNLAIQNEPGGCFCEALASGGFVRHGAVEYSDRGKLVRLSAALGPLQVLGATGTLSFNFSEAGGGTKLVVTYVVAGYQPDKGFAPLAEPVNSVLKEQVERLKRYAETGKPTASAAQ